MKSVIDDLPALRSGLSKQKDTEELWVKIVSDYMAQLKTLMEIQEQDKQDKFNALALTPQRGLPRKSSEYDNSQKTMIPEPLKKLAVR